MRVARVRPPDPIKIKKTFLTVVVALPTLICPVLIVWLGSLDLQALVEKTVRLQRETGRTLRDTGSLERAVLP